MYNILDKYLLTAAPSGFGGTQGGNIWSLGGGGSSNQNNTPSTPTAPTTPGTTVGQVSGDFTWNGTAWVATADYTPPATTPTTPTTPGTTVGQVSGDFTWNGSSWVATADYTPVPPAQAGDAGIQVTPGQAQGATQINVADYGGQVATNPSLALTPDDPDTPQNESMSLSDRVQGIDENAAGTNIDGSDPKYDMDASATNAATTQAATASAAAVDPREAVGYETQQTQDAVGDAAMTGAQGTVNPNAVIDAPQIDMQGTATGLNTDGTVNYVGEALKDFAEQDLDAVDPKATVKGQMEVLQEDFTGPNGEPVIPAYAAAMARNVAKIASFKGMTGSAATAAMAQALMEASLPIAQQDAQFFQTLTLQNLSNKQQSTINRANVLAKMDQINIDNRMAAAIQNSKNFMDMDLKNLDNEQQAAIINTQARVQSILEDAKAVNAERLFTAESQNEMAKFYDSLGSQIEQFNASQANNMNQFNAGEENATSKFNSELENQRQQFYKTMQYNIDTANAKWRQTVTLTESEQQFEAAAADVKNLVGISVEQMNQLWDRSDALLDYLFKSTESDLDRQAALVIAKLQAGTSKTIAQLQADAQDSAGWGSIFGSIGGAIAGSDQFLDWIF